MYVIFSDLFFFSSKMMGGRGGVCNPSGFGATINSLVFEGRFCGEAGGDCPVLGVRMARSPFLICIPAKSGAGIGRIPVRFAFGIRQTPPASLSAFVRISPGRFGRVRTGRTARLGIIYKHLFSWQDCFMVRKREEVCLSYSDTTSSGKIVDY